MKLVAYSDGERIESIVVYEADLSACLTNLQNKVETQVVREKAEVGKVVYVIQEEKNM